jgi:Helicase HerA, central domain
VSIWSWLKLAAFVWLIRKGFRLARWLLLAAAAVAAWPVTVPAAAGYTLAWLRGWPPARLYRAAAWSLPMAAAWLAWLEIRTPGFLAARDPGRTWSGGWGQLTPAGLTRVFAALAPVTLPAGLAVAGLIWAWRNYAITAGLGGITASAPAIFDNRQWNRQVRTAQGLTHAPGAVPLLARGGRIPVGGTIRAVGHPWHPVFTLDPSACARHMVIVGSTGSGKTNLMIRLWAGWFTATLQAWRAGQGGRPLLVVLDCKGGRDARKKAGRTRRLLYGAGARRVAIWPDEARLSIWDLPPQDLAVLLYQMIESGTGAAAYYADMLYACVVLAVTAPPGPPHNTASFLDRLDAKWLQSAWEDGRHPRQAAQARAAARHLRDIQLRFTTLLNRLGPALDGQDRLEDADAWYFILEGTREPSVAEAQAMALTELAARAATALDGDQRAILLAADDYSAVSRRVPMSNLYERGRSLGIGVQVSAQSWHGLGADEDERYRIAATADGGIFVLHTPHPEPLADLAGMRRVLETAHKLIGNSWGDEGTTREQRAWTADPDLIRRLTVGQACYIHHGAATFIQVARPAASPLTLLPPPAPQPPPAQVPEPRQEPAPPSRPPASGLDDIFGPGAPR